MMGRPRKTKRGSTAAEPEERGQPTRNRKGGNNLYNSSRPVSKKLEICLRSYGGGELTRTR